MRPTFIDPVNFHRVVVLVDEFHFHLDLFPGPRVKHLSIARAQARPVRRRRGRERGPALGKNKDGRGVALFGRHVEKATERTAAVKLDPHRLQQVFPPNALTGHVRERVRKDHLVVGVLFCCVCRKANEQIAIQHVVVVVVVVAEHDGFELGQTDDVQDPALGLLDFEFVFELLRPVTHIPRPLKVLIIPLLLLLLLPGAVSPSRAIVALSTGFVRQDFKSVNDLAKGFCGFIGRYTFVFVRMCVAGFATVGLWMETIARATTKMRE